jgi:hypothetical protein
MEALGFKTGNSQIGRFSGIYNTTTTNTASQMSARTNTGRDPAAYARKWEKSCCLDQAIASRQLFSVGSVTTRSKTSNGKSCCDESDSIALE